MSKATRRRKRKKQNLNVYNKEYTVTINRLLLEKIDKVTNNREEYILRSINLNLEHPLKEKPRHDLTGQKFGQLTALAATTKRSPEGYIMWACECECGEICKVSSHSLRQGKTRSCGCLKRGIQICTAPQLDTTKISSNNKYEYVTDEYCKSGERDTSLHIRRPVRCVETGEVYKTIKEAADAKGLKSPPNIGQVIRGKRKTAAGYHWEYAEENDNE